MKRLSVAVLFVLACGGNLPPDWHQPRGGVVTAALSSVTLGDDCNLAKTAPAESDQAPCYGTGVRACQNYCRQSSMQLEFGSTAEHAAQIEIRAVRLIDPSTGKVLANLKHRDPQQWIKDQYVTWDESLPGLTKIKATYKLSAFSPANALLGHDSRFAAHSYRVEVDVAVNDEVRTLTIEASIEPPVVT